MKRAGSGAWLGFGSKQAFIASPADPLLLQVVIPAKAGIQLLPLLLLRMLRTKQPAT